MRPEGSPDAHDAAGAGGPAQAPLTQHEVDMRQNLAEREAQLVRVEGLAEDHRHQLRRRQRLAPASLLDVYATDFMVLLQGFSPRMETTERQVVAGQDEYVLGQSPDQSVERAQVNAERIAVGVHRPDTHVR